MSLAVEPLAHPVADAFPMMSSEELRQLANDIEVNGQLHPIVLDAEGRVLDGRNRLAGCRLAGVEPSFITLDVLDPVGYVISQNINRRQMSQGAKAMAITKAVRDREKDAGHRRLREIDLRNMVGVGHEAMGQASTVYQYAPDYVEQVIRGGSLAEAYRMATDRKRKLEADQRLMKRLRKHHPELADRVEAGTLTLATADEIAKLLEQQARLDREIATLTEEVTLAEEEVERTLTLTAEQATALMEEQGFARLSGSKLKAGDVWEEVTEGIDTEELYRSEQILRGLQIRKNFMRMIMGHKPEDIYAGLGVEDIATAAASMETVFRWMAQAYQAGTSLSRNGRLEVVQ